MKHAASRELYAYWQEKRGTRPAPERTDIEPGAIRGVLAVLAGGRPDRAVDDRGPAPCRRGSRKAADAALHGAARPA
jgi:hypothetical protein